MIYHLIDSVFAIPTPFNFLLMVAMVVATTFVASVAAVQFRQYCSHRDEVELKRELVARGMSAQEIVTVIGARAMKSAV